jgi:hypothetical protein
MGGAVFERALQLQHHLAGAVTLEPFVGDRRAGDIAAQETECGLGLGFYAVTQDLGTAAKPRRDHH